MELNKIYNMDCLEGMRQIPDGSIDCIICDLPYGTTANSWDSVIPFEPLWEQYKRVRKNYAPIILFGSEPFSTMIRMSNIAEYKYDWIWHKDMPTGFVHARNKPLKDYEIISIFSDGTTVHESASSKRMCYNPQGIVKVNRRIGASASKFGNLVVGDKYNNKSYEREYENYPRMVLEGYGLDTDTFHPTQKPVDLLRYLVRTYSNEGETILDNCMGSGTTAIACIKEKRNFIGFELNEEYYTRATKRIQAEQSQLTLF